MREEFTSVDSGDTTTKSNLDNTINNLELIKKSKKLFEVFKEFNDIKSALWIPLSFRDKISIFMHQFSTKDHNNELEIAFMFTLMIQQHDPSFKYCRATDEFIEVSLSI